VNLLARIIHINGKYTTPYYKWLILVRALGTAQVHCQILLNSTKLIQLICYVTLSLPKPFLMVILFTYIFYLYILIYNFSVTSWVKKVGGGRKLQVSDKGNYGCSKFQYGFLPIHFPKWGFSVYNFAFLDNFFGQFFWTIIDFSTIFQQPKFFFGGGQLPPAMMPLSFT